MLNIYTKPNPFDGMIFLLIARPSPKLRKYCYKVSTVESEKQRDETDASEQALLSCQSSVDVQKPSQLTCTTKSHSRCKERKKPLVPRLENLNEDRESSKNAVGFILSPRADRPYKCTFCSKQFKYFSNLKSHMNIVHKKMVESSLDDSKDSIVRNGQVFQCEICFRNFKYFSNLRTHGLVHTSSELDSNNSQVTE